jgi:hypothetical protein
MKQATARTPEREALYERNGGFNKAPPWERLHGLVTARPTTRHPNFRRYLETFGLMTMVGISANLLAAPVARAESPGNFSRSCKDLRLNATDFSKTATLAADCKGQNGTYLKTEVNLNDLITNNHGSLQWRGRPGEADFQQSCGGDALSGSKLTSSCVESSEVKKSTQIDLNEKITNDNGKLTYISNPKSPGNFSGSCKNLRLNATSLSKTATLAADCKEKNGSYLNSQMNLNDIITNNHGSLQWGRPGSADFQQSCSGDALSGSRLASSCVESAGVKKSTQIDLNEKITNATGKLTYIDDQSGFVDTGPPPPPPHGPTMADLVGIAGGVDENPSAQAEFLDKIVDLGVHRVRVDFPWDLIEPKRGQWKWERYEDFLAAAAARDIDILGIFDYGVAWANKVVYPPNGDSKAPPDQFQDFTDYAKTVVEHFKGKAGAPTAYEIWNEPNAGSQNWHEPSCVHDTGHGLPGTSYCPSTGVSHAPRHEATGVYGDSDLFGALTAATISTIKGDKQLGQDIPLLAPGGTIFLWEPFVVIAGNESGPDFMSDAFKTNPQLASLSDAVTLHGYDAYPPSSEPESALPESGTINVQLGDKIAKMKLAFTSHGTSPNKPVWLTEIGWPTSSVDETAQARWLIRSIMLAALNGVDRIYIYKMYDGPSASAEDHFGLVGQDRNAKKKAYLAIQRFMHELGSLRLQLLIPSHDPRNAVYIVQLADGNGPQAWVVWANESVGPYTGYKWKPPANTSCEGIFGESCPISNGELAVSPYPVYVMAAPRLTRGPR